MKHDLTIEENGIRLIPITLEFSQQYRELRNKNCEWFLSKKQITAEMQRVWYKKYLSDDNDYMFAVFHKEAFVGGVAIYDVNNEKKMAEFGRLLIADGETRNRGIGTFATKLVSKIAREYLHVAYLYLHVKKDNVAAIKCYQRAGFKCGAMNEDILYMDKDL